MHEAMFVKTISPNTATLFPPHLHRTQYPEVVARPLGEHVHVTSDKLDVTLAEVRPVAGHVGHLVQFVEKGKEINVSLYYESQ